MAKIYPVPHPTTQALLLGATRLLDAARSSARGRENAAVVRELYEIEARLYAIGHLRRFWPY